MWISTLTLGIVRSNSMSHRCSFIIQVSLTDWLTSEGQFTSQIMPTLILEAVTSNTTELILTAELFVPTQVATLELLSTALQKTHLLLITILVARKEVTCMWFKLTMALKENIFRKRLSLLRVTKQTTSKYPQMHYGMRSRFLSPTSTPPQVCTRYT